MPGRRRNRVYLELGTKKVFACSVDWPGWARSGRDADQALAALADYAPRYAPVVETAGLAFDGATHGADVVERLQGSGATDFGVPHAIPALDAEPLRRSEAKRQAALVRAAWDYLGQVLASAPAILRKGPRGGGRDRDAIAAHVLGAEAAYGRQLGLRHREPDRADTDAIQAMRDDIIAVLSRPWSEEKLAPKGWPPRYAARRVAWHALDHAWEIEDKSQ